MSKTLAIMQPYFLPYIGYWQLMAYVDAFVIYDDVQFANKSWVNRNRFWQDGHDALFTLPLRKDRRFININERYLANDFNESRTTIIRRLEEAYKNAPFFELGMSILNECLRHDTENLCEFIYHSFSIIRPFLSIQTPMILSSSIPVTKKHKKQHRLIAICRELGAERYINLIGGKDIYDPHDFKKEGIDIKFLQVQPHEYNQNGSQFIPHLSIIDVIMFKGQEGTIELLNQMDLIE